MLKTKLMASRISASKLSSMSFDTTSKVLTSSDGTEIYAEAVGNPLKPHVVFVHGFTLSGAVFDRIFLNAKFQESYYLVSLVALY